MSAVVQHPRAVELIERRQLRKKIARAVSWLIAILDELDSDPEAEPWLGASSSSTRRTTISADGLPAPTMTASWRTSTADILDGGDEDQVDGEPSLGATEAIDQTGWARGGRRDLEADSRT